MTTRARLVQLRRQPIESVWTRNRRTWTGPGAQPPPPPPPPWPSLWLTAEIDWDGPWEPPPNWSWHRQDKVDWDDPLGYYYKVCLDEPDRVDVSFHLDLFNGNYYAVLSAYRNETNILNLSTFPASVEKGEYFHVEHNEWIGIPLSHTCHAEFWTQP